MRTRFRSSAAFTLMEMMVASAATVIVGATFFLVVRNMALLSAKNAAINLTHAQARTAIHRAVTEIRDSVSIPQLVDAAGVSLGTSSGPAAGVSYQQIISAPCLVWTTAAAGQSQVVIKLHPGDPAVTAGMRLVIPAFFVEEDITGVTVPTGTPAVQTLTLANPISTKITCTAGVPNYVAYVTQRSSLVVVGNELRYYAMKGAPTYAVVSSNITTPTPFTVPGNNRFIQATLATQDPRILSRNFKSMNMKLSLTIPYRFRLTSYQ